MAEPELEIEALGDRAILVRLAERIDVALNRRVHAAAAALRRWPEFSDVVPAYASLALHLAPGTWLEAPLLQRLREHLPAALAPLHDGLADGPTIALAVVFDGADLATVAATHGLAEATLIDRLCRAEYQVAMLGFLPGFPYLLGLDPDLALPRRAQPRTVVPANTLALGGAQLGIYPCASPGGWHLLGRLSTRLFEPERAAPALLTAGDRVRLHAVAGP